MTLLAGDIGGTNTRLALLSDESGPREFIAQIIDIALARARAERLGFQAVELLFLPNIGAKCDNLGVISFLKPGEQHRSVETAGVGEDDLHQGRDGSRKNAIRKRGIPD